MAINIKRIEKTLQDMAAFGRTSDGATTRLSYSSEFWQAQNYLKKAMQDIGMQVEVDAIGNLIGTLPGKDENLAAVMSGSHLDTVPLGGNYDGVLGIVAALEVARSWQEDGFVPKRSFCVIATIEEEGTAFGISCFGTRVRAGEFKKENAAAVKCTFSDGTLSQLLSAAKLPADALSKGAVGYNNISAFIELHIEQGAELDEHNLETGIVTHIVGYDRLYISLTGESNHAGTTAMHRRKDALAAGAEIVLAVRDLARKDSRFVATVGKFDVEPDAPNIVPGKVSMCIETRSYAKEILEEVHKQVMQIVEQATLNNNVRIIIENDFKVSPVSLDKDIIDTMELIAKAQSVNFTKMPSWAGHDAQIIASMIPTGMIFVPSIKGISHDKLEFSRLEDICKNVKLLDNILKKLAEK